MYKQLLIVSLLCLLICLPCFSDSDFSELLPADRLTDLAKQAIQAAPQWLTEDLTDNMERMEPDFQDVYANMIISPSEPRYRDEIAFCVASIGTANLQSADFLPELLEENVFYIYEHDQYLDYVQLVDMGDPELDADYYTTTHYSVEENGSLVEYELPREMYYWYIVHPKIEDEWALYIDPNAQGDVPSAPPTGVFWRDWIFTYTEENPVTRENYPILRDAMQSISAMWGNTDTGAIGALNGWETSILDFSSGSERPHQPVRIYRLHMGRCGEWQDFTTAAARACLIPCLNTQAMSEDHVWNEFWHLRWIHWEPVNGDGYIDNPLVYEDGWGKVFTGVQNVAGDGYFWDVIDSYSEGVCEITAIVTDANGDPVDGARLGVKHSGYVGCYGYAGSDGQVTVSYGDARTALGKIKSELGKYPPGGDTYEIVANTEDDGRYTWHAQYTTETIPQLLWTEKTSSHEGSYRLNVTCQVLGEVRTGAYNGDKANIYSRRFDSGSVDLFILDAENRSLYEAGQSFEAYEINRFSSNTSLQFTLPDYDTWSVVISAERKLTSEQIIGVDIRLEHNVDDIWTELSTVSRELSLMPGEKYMAAIDAGREFCTAIEMPTNRLIPGATCGCKAHVYNPEGAKTGQQIPLFVILDIFGELFFAPEFNDFSYFIIDDLQTSVKQTFEVLPEFTWPEGIQAASGLMWYAGMTTPDMTELLGQLDIYEFQWSN